MQIIDITIIGQGPAGLSAAIYTSRAGLDTLVLGCEPKVAGDYDIDNYFGFPEGIKGRELIQRGCEHASRFGAELRCERVLSIRQGDDDQSFKIKTDQNEYYTRAVILATGVSRVRPGIKNLTQYEGRGVSYCVSCDGFFFRNKKVVVLGEGLFAANQALELLEYNARVLICPQGKKVDIPDYYLQRLHESDISFVHKKIVRLDGDQVLQKIIFEDGSEQEVDGVFVAMGEASSLDFAYSLGLITHKMFVDVDHEQKTNVPGIFAAGDCVGTFLQISVAVGEGAVAGRSAINHVKQLKKEAAEAAKATFE